MQKSKKIKELNKDNNQDKKQDKKLIVMIPAYNEEQTISQVIKSIPK